MVCLVPLSVGHMLIECPEYNAQRIVCFGNMPNSHSSKIIGETPHRVVNMEDIYQFLSKLT